MKHRKLSRIVAMVLFVVMLVGALPLSAFALPAFDESVTNDYYTIMSKNDYVLCDGAIESEIVINNDSGSRRQVLHVIEVDPDNPNVEVLPAYYQIDKDLTDSSNWTAQIMEKQMDYYRDELGYNVVAGMNTALAYDSEAPSSFLVWNGQVLATPALHGNSQTYLAVTKNGDGTVKFELRNCSEALHGDEWQAVSCNFGFVVKDGELVSKTVNRSDAADRSMIGIKADGTLVICQAEGRNAPYAVGLSSYELGETMLALGCVWAVNGDGGGSSQILTRREGEADYSLRNIPSDGSPRATINGIIVASKTKPTGEFDHVSMTTANPYITPGTSVAVDVKGVDASGSAAEMPAEGITYTATGGTFVDGSFISDGTVGVAVVKTFYKGEEVGSIAINVVKPTAISFDSPEMVIPYNKTVKIGVTAYYNAFELVTKPSDFVFVMDNPSIGSISGVDFTAVATEIENNSSKVTVKYALDDTLNDEATLTLGKGSEILYDFEDQDLHGFYRGTAKNYNYNNPTGVTKIVDSTTGRVHNGQYAMAVEVDFSNSLEAGFQLGSLITGEQIDLENALTLGMWLYVPDEAVGLRIDSGVPGFSGFWSLPYAGETQSTEVGFVNGLEESGWHYITLDISSSGSLSIAKDIQLLKFYISQKDGKNGYSYGDQTDVNGQYTFYVDDITVDYSAAVDDREAPIFSGLSYATPGMDESVTLLKDTNAGYTPVIVTSNTLSFAATVAENTAKSNYTGIDQSTGAVYIDGVAYTNQLVWSGSRMSLDVTLPDGRHEIKFTVCDKMGNYSSIIREIIVNSADTSAIKVVPHDPTANRLLLGSIYYIDVVAPAIEKVQSVSLTLDLNNISIWYLDQIEATDGFSVEYTLTADENIAEITITKTGTVAATGEAVLISIPTRTWEKEAVVAIYGHAGKVWMYPDYKKGNEILPMSLSVETDKGQVTYTDGTTAVFTSPKIQVMTELSGNAYTSSGSAADNYIRNEPWYKDWNGGHDHRVETHQYYAEGATNVVVPVAVADKAPTCTENGYTGRTFCETCQSVVDWGTTVPATGHTYEVVDGKLVCKDCDETMTQSGVVKVGDEIYYSIGGKLGTGWIVDDGNYYYFNVYTYSAYTNGTYKINGYEYTFDADGYLTRGQWVNTFENGVLVTKYIYAGRFVAAHFHEVDGKTYWFDTYGNMARGTQILRTSMASGINNMYIYVIGDDGVVEGILDHTGTYELNGKIYYVVDGLLTAAGLTKIDGYYYYVDWDATVATGKVYVETKYANGYLTAGWYYTAADGHFYHDEYATVDGVRYYMLNGRPSTLSRTELREVDGYLYYYLWDGSVATGKVYVETKYANGLTTAGWHYTDETGRFYNNEIVNIDGINYYMINGRPDSTGTTALREIDGDLYYIDYRGEVMTGKVYVETKYANGLTTAGWHYTDADGRFYNEELASVNGSVYYFVNGKFDNTGKTSLREINGSLYYVDYSGQVMTGKIYVETKYANGLTTAGWHYTDANGRLYNEEVVSVNGKVYYMVNGKPDNTGKTSLREINGGLYYVDYSGVVLTGKVYVETKYANGLTTAGWHYTDANGRFYNDEVVNVGDKVYYLVNGKPANTGVTSMREVGGKLYYVEYNGVVATGKVYVESKYAAGLASTGWHYTDENGAFYNNEFVEMDGKLYYMVKGVPSKAGVFMVAGDLYYADPSTGCVAVSTKLYIEDQYTNGNIVAGWHEFDAEGKMIS